MKLKREHLLFLAATLGIIALYFLFRVYNIMGLPLFTDEAIYVRWAQIASQDPNWRFISLTDGKGTSFIWISILFLKFFKDPVLAVRMVSVFAGLATAVGFFFLGNELFRNLREKTGYKLFSFTNETVSIGLLASLIYAIYPFGLVYDRMALYDSLVGTCAVWALYFLIVMARSLRLDIAMLAGFVAGLGALTKANGFFSVYSIPLLVLLFPLNIKTFKAKLFKFAGLAAVVAVLAFGIYSIQRLSPFFHIIDEKTTLFVYPIGEWIRAPFAFFPKNATALIRWFVVYFSIVPLLLVAASFVIKKDHLREKLVLLFWALFPFIALCFFGNTIYPRFILFMTLPLIPLVAYSLYHLLAKYKKTVVKLGILLFAFGFYLYADYFIIFNFARAPIPNPDTDQYINNWSAGNGLSQSVEFFRNEAADKKIHIVTEGTFGLMPYGLEIYLVDNPNIKIEAIWPIKDAPPESVIKRTKSMPTYAVFYQPCPACNGSGNIPPLWRAEKIATYKQGVSDYYYSIYKLLP